MQWLILIIIYAIILYSSLWEINKNTKDDQLVLV